MYKIPLTKTAAIAAMIVSFGAAHGATMTINTSKINANGTLTLSDDAAKALYLAQISFVPAGTASEVSSNVFNVPITQLSVSVSLLPPSVAPTSGVTKGAVFEFDNALTGKSLSLTNLLIDYKSSSIYADVDGGGTVQSHQQVFTFDVTEPLALSFKGGLSMTQTLGNLHMTQAAAHGFVEALSLPSFFAPVLTSLDFGSIHAVISPTPRKSALTMHAVQAVPEASTTALMGGGLLTMLLVFKRRRVRQA